MQHYEKIHSNLSLSDNRIRQFRTNADFKFKFYGQIRTDFYYNSRANEETVDGLFYMYPKDKVRDPKGNDLNSTPNSNFYTLYSRLGVDVAVQNWEQPRHLPK